MRKLEEGEAKKMKAYLSYHVLKSVSILVNHILRSNQLTILQNKIYRLNQDIDLTIGFRQITMLDLTTSTLN